VWFSSDSAHWYSNSRILVLLDPRPSSSIIVALLALAELATVLKTDVANDDQGDTEDSKEKNNGDCLISGALLNHLLALIEYALVLVVVAFVLK